MLLFEYFMLVGLCIALASSQDSDPDSTCSKQPIVQNFYSSDISSFAVVSNDCSNIAQGRPGRIGPPGPLGPKGSKVIIINYLKVMTTTLKNLMLFLEVL